MSSLTNKRILLGITGGIAAYKCADLTRRLRDAGAEVRVVMTNGATRFITPLTLEAVSGHPVHLHLFASGTDDAQPPEDTASAAAMDHITLARWADAVLVAPASANFLAKLGQGRADDLLTTLCLANEAPLAVAPAMNQQMWLNPATQANMATLRQRGISVYGPAEGSQACGETGPGRMLEPAELVDRLTTLFTTGALAGIRVMITAGPTWEPLDPVRGLTNRSSGKMGYALADAAAEAGARVTLISGPTALADPERVHTVRVSTALDMDAAVRARITQQDIFIGVAAVADYRPLAPASHKLKKDARELTLKLVRNPDILAAVAMLAQPPFTVGFAAETDHVVEHARDKLQKKGLDLVAANQVGVPGTGFESDQNQVTLVDRDGTESLPAMPKTRLARVLIQEIAARYHAKSSTPHTRSAHRQ